jgi:hypothetical protein
MQRGAEPLNLCLRPTTPDQPGKEALPLSSWTSAFAQPGDQVTLRGTVRILPRNASSLGTTQRRFRLYEPDVHRHPPRQQLWPPNTPLGSPAAQYDPYQPEAPVLKGTLPIHYLGPDDPGRL